MTRPYRRYRYPPPRQPMHPLVGCLCVVAIIAIVAWLVLMFGGFFLMLLAGAA